MQRKFKMTKKRYFHIQNLNGTNTIWNKGDIINITDENCNSFYNDLVTSTGAQLNGNKIDLFKYAKEQIKSTEAELLFNRDSTVLLDQYIKKSSVYRQLTEQMEENLQQYLKWIREEIFENYRQENFPRLPSRKSCLWLSELQDLEKWWTKLYPKKQKKIIEVDLLNNSKTHTGNGSLIILETLNVTEYAKLAEEYWHGKMIEDCEVETLFEGQFKVINEYTHINQI